MVQGEAELPQGHSRGLSPFLTVSRGRVWGDRQVVTLQAGMRVVGYVAPAAIFAADVRAARPSYR